MDQFVNKIVALGVPGLVLLVVMATTGWAGAAAITTALATLGGPFGMLGGIAMLGILGLIAKALSDYGAETVVRAVVKGLKEKGLSKDDIEKEIDSYPISRILKLKIKDYLDKLEQREEESEHEVETAVRAVVKQLKEKGMSKDDIEKEIDSYAISEILKLKIKDYLRGLIEGWDGDDPVGTNA